MKFSPNDIEWEFNLMSDILLTITEKINLKTIFFPAAKSSPTNPFSGMLPSNIDS